MVEVRLKLPLNEEDVRRLNLGDIVYLTGTIYTARDEAHIHILEELRKGHKIGVEFRGSAIFHCGPIMKKVDGKWKVVAAGPTTSTRMNSLEPEFIERTGVRAIIGKGGMSRAVADAMAKFGCVYLSMTGGAAVLAADRIKDVKGVYLEELGMPEAVWILEVEEFGPLIVGIDAKGNSWFERVEKAIQQKVPQVKARLGI
ncbi:MAG: FumA C-terminus/TtdB family hydratase beta subunit [Nitrososphaerota archaeon]